MGQRVGVFGGTFDPPHSGHLAVARAAKDSLGLDLVLLVVANQPWQKVNDRKITAASHRLAMTELLVEHVDGIEASDIEIVRGGASYTFDTVEQLNKMDCESVLILGSDAAAELDSWERATELRALVEVAVVPRPGHVMPALRDWKIQLVNAEVVDISSSEIRAMSADDVDLDPRVPQAVRNYISDNELI
tara:strand:- start:185 stop:754 length:570 start_codon:yes stop_codon:yes gene_type:complete